MTVITEPTEVKNFINGNWENAETNDFVEVTNPATSEVLARTPLSSSADVEKAVSAAERAFPLWRRTPSGERVQYLFRLKAVLEEHLDELAMLITAENGKTLAEARAELRRAIENVETACGIPTMMQGTNLEDIARGIDETLIRQPLGVVAAITPFNFPAMIPFWFLPYAIACGNTFVLKPSERVPLTMQRAVRLIEMTGLPKGVVNLLQGGRSSVEALCDHPSVRAISFVGSTPVAKQVYTRAAAAGKRMQCQGGAKNHVVVLPDAKMDLATRIVSDSAFGCAGQRCLAISVAITVGEAQNTFRESIARAASDLKVGNGMQKGIDMGPVISRDSLNRVNTLVEAGVRAGAKHVAGSLERAKNESHGNFMKPTVLEWVSPTSPLADTEVFGPVLSLVHADSLDEAIDLLQKSRYGNQASLFTTNGAAARRFKYEAQAGNIGINVGVAAPMAYFPFSGWKDSFLGILHAQGSDAVDFYTQSKVVVERWGWEETRHF